MADPQILLVEDNPDDEELLVFSLRRQGLAAGLVVVRDGVEALEFLLGEGAHADRQSCKLPAVMLLDLKLPRLDGLGVLRRLRSDPRTRHLPVVVLTSSSQDADIAASYAQGANSYVRKPVDFDELTRTISAVGHYWVTLNRGHPGE